MMILCLILLILLDTTVFTQHMTLCDYFEKLGIAKAECGHVIRPVVTTPIDFQQPGKFRFSSYPSSLQTQFGSHLPLCRNYFHSCMSSDNCESGTICTNGLNQGSCCTNPHRSNCPTVTSLNINCRKTRSVNWCNTDTDCRGGSTTASMCCPTGCNYNMCIHVGQQIYHPRRSVVFSSLSPLATTTTTDDNDVEYCPDPYVLNVKCVATKGANWCYTDADCRSGLYKRKCCATLCGYNTCLMKFNNKWIIA